MTLQRRVAPSGGRTRAGTRKRGGAAPWPRRSSFALTLLFASAWCTSEIAGQAFPDSAFDARTGAELRAILGESRAAGLPEGPLLNRIRQGAARRVAAAQLVALVRAHADSMRAARNALGAGASNDELDAGASALHAGASRTMLRRLRRSRPEGSATTALVVLTDLLWRGVPPADAADAITTLAQRSGDQALLALQVAVAREGTPASAERLHSLIERLVIPPSTPRPPPPGASSGESARASARPSPGASLALASLSAPGSASPHAVLAEGSWSLPFAPGWLLSPAPSLRLADDEKRWGVAVTVARDLHPGPSARARLWLGGELRSPMSHARSELPLSGSIDARTTPPGRARDLALFAGAELHRQAGGWSIASSVTVGRTRFSTLETILVTREVPGPIDTITPRPDTLTPRLVTEPKNVWRIFTGSTAQGGLSLRRGAYLVRGGVAWRLGELRRGGDSVQTQPRTLLTVGAERQLSPRSVLVAQWASRDPSRITGTLALSDARWRLGLRLVQAPTTPPPRPRPPTVATTATSRAISVTVEADSSRGDGAGGDGTQLTVRVTAPGAQSVEVEGDLTEWAPTALSHERGGVFVGRFVSAGSLVRLRLRIDGGVWIVPADAPTQRDEFGDVVAVYVLGG